ncbi:MBL fold metallo-hydrolase [Streptomyces sp. HUCO-GS316]|uniref:MBL fold metallo-hydrolase n=1 Tax=Streptomyces sp. HUCO-GS316 TaxID=2692198 RepID=UPI0013701DC4|nr:MBL fold metallo-hydrolase [Streptomyces sp. HUCO-GS316]MXM68986.1 MBL fold metallo-hydrolase [Streptomyces sp. HUCO-GS316]
MPHGTTPGRARTQEIADGVHAYTQESGGWCVNNAGILLDGRRGPVVVDTAATQARARRLRAAVRALTAAPPRLLVNTHFHGDHTFGNALVGGRDTVVVGHGRARTEMASAGLGLTGLWPDVDWGAIELRLPDVTYDGRMELHLDRRTVQLLHPGPAHTTTDTLVWLPEEKVLFAGDVLMSGCTPFLLMGSLSGSVRAVERIRALGPRTIVGGHGPVCGPEVLDETAEYLRWLRRTAEGALEAGLEPLEAARQLGAHPYQEWLDPERLVGNLHRACAELRGGPEGEPLDALKIFGEMVDFNGGRTPTCLA